MNWLLLVLSIVLFNVILFVIGWVFMTPKPLRSGRYGFVNVLKSLYLAPLEIIECLTLSRPAETAQVPSQVDEATLAMYLRDASAGFPCGNPACDGTCNVCEEVADAGHQAGLEDQQYMEAPCRWCGTPHVICSCQGPDFGPVTPRERRIQELQARVDEFHRSLRAASLADMACEDELKELLYPARPEDEPPVHIVDGFSEAPVLMSRNPNTRASRDVNIVVRPSVQPLEYWQQPYPRCSPYGISESDCGPCVKMTACPYLLSRPRSLREQAQYRAYLQSPLDPRD